MRLRRRNVPAPYVPAVEKFPEPEDGKPTFTPGGYYKVWQLPDGKWGMELQGNSGWWYWDGQVGEWKLRTGYIEVVARHEFHDSEAEARAAAFAAWDVFTNKAQGALVESAAVQVMIGAYARD